MMKSATIAAALLASVAIAQPHGHKRHHHEKRDLVTEWETVWETATVVIEDDSTQTLGPSPKETRSGSPGQFFQPDPPSSSSSASSVVETPEVATAEALSQTTQTSQTTPTTTISLTQPTYPASSPTTLTTTTQAAPAPPTTTQAAPAPPTTTQAAPAPPTTTAEAVTPTTSSTYAASPPASSTGSSSGGSTGSDGIPYSQDFSGEITYYNVALGACGYDDSGKDETENIVAIPKDFWDNISSATSYGIDQPAHPLCNKKITIKAPDGTAVTAVIRDRCAGCAGHAIDVTPKAFKDLFGSLDGGRLDCSWEIDE